MLAGFAKTYAFVITVIQWHILMEDVYYDLAIFVYLSPLGTRLVSLLLYYNRLFFPLLFW